MAKGGRAGRTYVRDGRGRFASTPGGSARKSIGGLPRRQPRRAGTPPPQRRGLVTQRAAVRRSTTKLKGKDPADQSITGTLSRRSQKGAVTRAKNRLAAAEASGRRRIAPRSQAGILRPKPKGKGKAAPAAPVPGGKPAVRGRGRLRMFATGRDGVILKKVFDAYKDNPFDRLIGPRHAKQNLAAAGEWLAKQGQFLRERFRNSNRNWVASASVGRPGINLNSKNDYWGMPASEAKRVRRLRWWSSGAPTVALHHEIGHTRDINALSRLRADPKGRSRKYNKWRSLMPKTVGPTKAKKQEQEFVKIASRVSGYAATAPTEFVAETYAGLRTGQRYDRQVMALYRELMGSGDPALRARRSRRPRRRG